jgi:hypothetical protein
MMKFLQRKEPSLSMLRLILEVSDYLNATDYTLEKLPEEDIAVVTFVIQSFNPDWLNVNSDLNRAMLDQHKLEWKETLHRHAVGNNYRLETFRAELLHNRFIMVKVTLSRADTGTAVSAIYRIHHLLKSSGYSFTTKGHGKHHVFKIKRPFSWLKKLTVPDWEKKAAEEVWRLFEDETKEGQCIVISHDVVIVPYV